MSDSEFKTTLLLTLLFSVFISSMIFWDTSSPFPLASSIGGVVCGISGMLFLLALAIGYYDNEP